MASMFITIEDVKIMRMEIVSLEATLIDVRNELDKQRAINDDLRARLEAATWRALAAEGGDTYARQKFERVVHKTANETPRTGIPVVGYWTTDGCPFVYTRMMMFTCELWFEYSAAYNGSGLVRLGGKDSSCPKEQPDAWQYPATDDALALLKGE